MAYYDNGININNVVEYIYSTKQTYDVQMCIS